MTDVEVTSSFPGSTVITREPQYIDPALVSGMVVSPPRPLKPSADGVPVKDKSIDERAGPSHAQPPLHSQLNMTAIREQTVSRLQAQKNKHVKDLSLKKDQLQKLLQKLDSPGSHECGSKWHNAEVLGELSMVTSSPEDIKRERTHERSFCTMKNNVSSPKEESEDCLKQTQKSFPLSLASVVVIELVTFITGIVKVLIMGLVEVVGGDVITPLFGAMFNIICEPVIRFLRSISMGIRDVLRPLLALVMEFVQHIALIIQAFRLVEINRFDLPQQSMDL
ncbi:uncharacterized protein LOC121697716 isoform X2 [Alosa sapidissima]|uniref:uncharacterized protein LOC121697716 isoform X2 n=1 Tax=Alosa sapidissima TaxID=34773 RepID=UPI001C0A0AB0|nr:uncharacterized protein LOC121697716 isoform X2 [Alosa sapidissima]